jgi:outer membrane protein OmpA-like peptidoglycan-associated protein
MKLWNLLIILLMAAFLEDLRAQSLEPTETSALINLTFTDFNKAPRQGDTVLFKSSNTGETHVRITDSAGTVSLLLPTGDSYVNKIVLTSGDTVDYGTVEVKAGKGKMRMKLMREYSRKTFILENVFFDFGKASLKKESFPALDELYKSLDFNPTMQIEIAGHTDSVGSDQANLKLSQGRANSVRAYLIKKGIEARRVQAKGYGETQPIASNSTEKGRQMNRRTEVRVLKE